MAVVVLRHTDHRQDHSLYMYTCILLLRPSVLALINMFSAALYCVRVCSGRPELL